MLIEDELKLNIEYEIDNDIKYIKINENNISYQIQLLSKPSVEQLKYWLTKWEELFTYRSRA